MRVILLQLLEINLTADPSPSESGQAADCQLRQLFPAIRIPSKPSLFTQMNHIGSWPRPAIKLRLLVILHSLLYFNV